MKKVFKITGFLVVASGIMLSSCLKDNPLTLDTDQTNNVTEFANTGSIATLPSGIAAPRFSIDLGSLGVGDTASFNVNVDYAGANMAPQDISVVIDIDNSLLNIYNEEHSVDGANYVTPPDDLFTGSFPITIVIPKGQQFGQAKIPVKLPADYDFTLSYALPLKISSTSVGVISGNFGSALYALNVRNVYDGVYDINGYILREGDAVLSGNYSGYQVNMITSGPYSIQYDHHPWRDGSTVGGIDGLTLTIDPATNKVTVSCATNPAVVNDPGYDSRYDPASKTFYVSYYWGSGPTNRAATDTLVYSGPR
jgi:hypothetical protein